MRDGSSRPETPDVLCLLGHAPQLLALQRLTSELAQALAAVHRAAEELRLVNELEGLSAPRPDELLGVSALSSAAAVLASALVDWDAGRAASRTMARLITERARGSGPVPRLQATKRAVHRSVTTMSEALRKLLPSAAQLADPSASQ